ncbi:hypothetical protein VTK73DRAFT_1491 [Phialemonium thermophilum]|uniref:Uncharacterized protein n=1 Tax=Phialemonium thermophilum TaxID=223376 RepID=A0ABR3X959_9PEZI
MSYIERVTRHPHSALKPCQGELRLSLSKYARRYGLEIGVFQGTAQRTAHKDTRSGHIERRLATIASVSLLQRRLSRFPTVLILLRARAKAMTSFSSSLTTRGPSPSTCSTLQSCGPRFGDGKIIDGLEGSTTRMTSLRAERSMSQRRFAGW